MADHRPVKLARLQNVRDRLPYVSQSALAVILRIAKEEGVPEASTRQHVRAARDATVFQATPYGRIHQSVDVPLTAGGSFALEVQHPFAMLHHAAATSQAFSGLVQRTLLRYPGTPGNPWRLVFYTDGVGPGNPLGYKHLRKFLACYYTFVDFGAAAISDEECWFELSVCRNSIIDTLVGGESGLIAFLIDQLLFNKGTHCMRTSGVLIKLFSGDTVRIFIKFSMYIADADALRAAFGFKGASGLKNCPKCLNVYNGLFAEGRDIIARDTARRAVLHSCVEPEKFEPLTPPILCAIRQRLIDAHAVMGADEFSELQTRLGWNYIPAGLTFSHNLLDDVNPCNVLTFDPAHVYFVNGIFNSHFGLAFRELHVYHNIKYPFVANYVATWHWPTAVGSLTGATVLMEDRWKGFLEKRTWACSASEGKSLVPVLATFAESVLLQSASERVRAIGASIVLLGEVVQLLDRCSREDVNPDSLARAIKAHVVAFSNLFEPASMVPKFHYAFHIHETVRFWRLVLSCLVLERKHRVPKRYANPAKNTRQQLRINGFAGDDGPPPQRAAERRPLQLLGAGSGAPGGPARGEGRAGARFRYRLPGWRAGAHQRVGGGPHWGRCVV